MLDVLASVEANLRRALERRPRPRKLETERKGIPLTYFSMPYFTIFSLSDYRDQLLSEPYHSFTVEALIKGF